MRNAIGTLLLNVLLGFGIFLVGCSSDDGGGDDMDAGLTETNPSLALTVDGTEYEITFDTDDFFTGSAIGGVTSVITTINASDGTTIAFAAVLGGQATGTYNLTTSIDENEETAPGMDIAIFNFNTGVSLSLRALDMDVNVTSYQEQNIFANVGGTFSGTMQDEETSAIVNVSGSFQTGIGL